MWASSTLLPRLQTYTLSPGLQRLAPVIGAVARPAPPGGSASAAHSRSVLPASRKCLIVRAVGLHSRPAPPRSAGHSRFSAARQQQLVPSDCLRTYFIFRHLVFFLLDVLDQPFEERPGRPSRKASGGVGGIAQLTVALAPGRTRRASGRRSAAGHTARRCRPEP